MNGDLYELISMAMRYVFAALMALIVIRAWRITLVDSRRAASLRKLSPETGLCGEFLVVRGHGKAREGMRYPVIREGLIGSASKCDVRLRSPSVRRGHASFELTSHGLLVQGYGDAKIYDAQGAARTRLYLNDGARITFGSVELMLILNEAVAEPIDQPESDLDDLFDLQDGGEPADGAYRRPAKPSVSPEDELEHAFDPPQAQDPADAWLDGQPEQDPFELHE